jgi:hypothetical protein
MPQDGYNYQFNDAQYPVALPPAQPISSVSDPALYTLSLYFTNLINNYLSPAFAAQAQNCGLYNSTEYLFANGSAVGDFVTNPLNPTLLTTSDYLFPLCSVYRETEEFHQMSLVRDGVLSRFVFQYVLPPLSQAQYNSLYNFLGQLSKTILHFGFQGNDPLYLDGASILQQAQISFTTWEGSKYQPIVAMDAKGNGLFFPSISIRFTVFEQEFFVAGNYEPIGGVDLVVDGYTDGYSIADGYLNVGLGSISQPIQMTSFNPTSGPRGGATWVAISGQGFLGLAPFPAVPILVCNVPVTQQLCRADNLVLVQTGTSLQAISGPIQITDNLGNTYFSSTNYSYT